MKKTKKTTTMDRQWESVDSHSNSHSNGHSNSHSNSHSGSPWGWDEHEAPDHEGYDYDGKGQHQVSIHDEEYELRQRVWAALEALASSCWDAVPNKRPSPAELAAELRARAREVAAFYGSGSGSASSASSR